jgi:predicted acetyltransferase
MTELRIPDLIHLPAYVAALERGWSPNTTRNVCAEQLGQIEADPAAFLQKLVHPHGTIPLPSGALVPMLPGTTRWIWDEGFCGSINIRYEPGTTDLPPHVSGHIGYSVVPWRQRQGHGTRALALMLPMAAAYGLPWVIITCNVDNAGSRRVIEANGGVYLCDAEDHLVFGTDKSVFRVDVNTNLLTTV